MGKTSPAPVELIRREYFENIEVAWNRDLRSFIADMRVLDDHPLKLRFIFDRGEWIAHRNDHFGRRMVLRCIEGNATFHPDIIIGDDIEGVIVIANPVPPPPELMPESYYPVSDE